ncbi:plasmid partitioning protein RepA [Notoacmeibacter sp. MSK16QG-6]|uniref:plasmid partitioning protein RepA n=1 Tax=Notoacmeibacter sp. MSK16QG-6 TaxID=2957982 RepID=UPI00209D649F|nr:plasmid partitioning protein RepA [Notoacmeibacter sp. MSK16QG-6]MCP1200631.1 plasmid partitioning protein RepA [Notoacmeibacter sp. MSK16QG-6]
MSDASPLPPADEQIAADAALLSEQLSMMRHRLFPPTSRKTLRAFTSGEAARLIGVSDSYLRQLSINGEGPQPETGPGGRRLYTLTDINAMRRFLAEGGGPKARTYLPWRDPAAGEPLQVIAVTNFKGGSGKTTTSTHLAQYLALAGYRVLAVDLDPQASMSALFGYQPEIDLSGNDTLYGAIRYDEERRPLRDIIQPTYFDGLDLVPGNLELQEFEHTTPRHLTSGRDREDGPLFFARLQSALGSVADDYDVVVLDCPPQLGYLTLSALCAATSVIVTVHPQMLDIASMSQFLLMTSDLLAVVREAGARLDFSFMRYLVTRYEPNDGPQTQITAFLRSQLGERVLTAPMVKSTAISDAGLTKQTLYEVGRENFNRATYDRAMEALTAVNSEIEGLIRAGWGRSDRSREGGGSR